MMEPVESLRRLVELESPTGDAARIAHAGSRLRVQLSGCVTGGDVCGSGP